MLRYSRYNHVVKIPEEDACVLYNFRTGAFLRLDPVKKAVFDNATDLPEDSGAVEALRQGGFLVAYDELRHMRTQAFAAGGTGRFLGLTICPTLACNFCCPYCFEQARSGRMSREVQDRIVGFARENLENFGLDGLDVVWYGGEPLLCPDIIESLSARLQEVCRDCGAAYTARIITNGWLLTEENADLLERAKVGFFQITLDGPTPETNDHLRRSKDGGSSFRRIMENLRKMRPFAMDPPKGYPADYKMPHIQIRCNINRDNAHLYGALAEQIHALSKEKGIGISVYPSKMDSSEENQDRIRNCTLESGEFAQLIGVDALIDRMHSKYNQLYCMAQYPHAYCIDELGNLYKCSELVGRDEYVIGNVRDYSLLREPGTGISGVDAFFETLFPEDDRECMACKVFPLCLGGCPRKRVQSKRECWPMKDNPDDFVLAQYRLRSAGRSEAQDS